MEVSPIVRQQQPVAGQKRRHAEAAARPIRPERGSVERIQSSDASICRRDQHDVVPRARRGGNRHLEIDAPAPGRRRGVPSLDAPVGRYREELPIRPERRADLRSDARAASEEGPVRGRDPGHTPFMGDHGHARAAALRREGKAPPGRRAPGDRSFEVEGEERVIPREVENPLSRHGDPRRTPVRAVERPEPATIRRGTGLERT